MVGVNGARQAPVRPVINPVDEVGIAFSEKGNSSLATACKTLLLPDFIKPPWVAAIALQKILAADPQPPRDPDVYGIVRRKLTWACNRRGERNSHRRQPET